MCDPFRSKAQIVFPTVLHEGGQLRAYSGKEAFTHALKSGEFIEFKTKGEADWFSKNYKKVWDKK